jgi:phospholipase D1/2
MEPSFLFKPEIKPVDCVPIKGKNDTQNARDHYYIFGISFEYKQMYHWEITRTYQEFLELDSNLNRYMNEGSVLSVPKIPSGQEFKKSEPKTQLEILEQYLTELVEQNDICNNEVFWEFLEVSVLSFCDVSKKRKEGYVDKRTGGRVGNEKRWFNCTKYCKRLQRRWLIVRDNMVGYLSNHMKGSLHEVLMFKGKFEVLKGEADTGYSDGILINTHNRKFYFRAGSEQKMIEWYSEIQNAKNESEWQMEDHRFESSFPIRHNNQCRWFVDAIYYFNEVCESLSRAKKEVFISAWWLSPELYLKRPSTKFGESQVLEILGKLADRGVLVYIHVYKEVSFALTLNSLHTKTALQKRNPNIKIVRHPHRSVVGGEFLWSHHEKIVCIDQEIAFIGGLDLCYGRMDTSEHRLSDTTEPYFWNGIDYSNVRVADFNDVQNWERDSMDRKKQPRMPWHDIALKAVGKIAADVALHFIELWNHVMTDITGNYHKDKALLKPKPEYSHMKTIKELFEEEDKLDSPLTTENDIKVRKSMSLLNTPLSNRIIKKFNTSHIKKKVVPYQAPRTNSEFSRRINVVELDLRVEEDESCESKAILIENMEPEMKESFFGNYSLVCDDRFSLSNESSVLLTKKPSTDISFIDRDKKNKLEVEDENKLRTELNDDMKEGDEAWSRNLLMPKLKESGNVGHCECQVIRSAGTWSLGLERTEHSIHTAYLNLIDQADHFIYIENQFFISNTAGDPVKNSIAQALVDRIGVAARNKEKFKVIVVLPLLPGFAGDIDDNSASVLRVQLHWLYSTISRSKTSIISQLLENPNISNPYDYIDFYGLRTHGVINKRPVTEIVYVHSKLMIVDDDKVIIGSANINDRSQVGNHDSEIAMVINDQNKIQTLLAGSARPVSKFAHSLRTNIFKELLGISDENILNDPLSEQFLQSLKTIAANNTKTYKSLFRCYPDNEFQRFQHIPEFESPTLDSYHTLKHNISGFIVEFPLDFLHDEDLKIKIFNKEFYIPEESFI